MNRHHIKIEQTLHGYSNGHRLIKSSTSFAKDVERTLLLMSDMSGPSMVKGFEEYLSGYPLTDEIYAFSKTWYADEMKRPGCVWTHTLIIESRDLSRIDDLQTLNKLFQHPPNSNLNVTYDSSLNLNSSYHDLDNYSVLDSNISEYIAAKVLQGLYGHPEEPVYIVADNSHQYENLALKLWGQQWPELRTTFCFCTGAISNRRIGDRNFDLQIIPMKNEKQINRDVQKGIYIEKNNADIIINENSWLSIALEDIYHRGSNRKLLWEFAKNSKGGRKEYAGYIEIIDTLKSMTSGKQSISHLTDKICNVFPAPEDARNLKAIIYGDHRSNNNLSLDIFSTYNESTLLKELLTTKHYNSFNIETLNFMERANKLWKYNKWEAQELITDIISANLNPLGESFLSYISESLEPYDLINLGSENAALLHIFLNLNPSLAASSVLWERSDIDFSNLIQIVANSKNITKSITREILNEIFQSYNGGKVDDLLKAFGDITISVFLDWLNKDRISFDKSNDLYYSWKSILKNKSNLVIDWLSKSKNIQKNTLEYLCSVLDPNSSDLVKLGATVWMPLTKKGVSQRKNIEVKAFLLALGFNNPVGNAEKLVEMSFEQVHNAIAKDSLNYHCWNFLEQSVPSVPWWMKWDKCELLRRALVEKFIKFKWSPQVFLLSIDNDRTFNKIVKNCKSDNRYLQFIKTVRDKVVHDEISATNTQKKILIDSIN